MQKLSRRALLAGLAGAAVLPRLGAKDRLQSAASPRQAGQRLNLIEIVVDTWSAGWLGCYGNAVVSTPNVDALAAKSAVFLDAYPDSLPVIPARRALYTGRQCFPGKPVRQLGDTPAIRGWHQLYQEDATMSESLRGAGYTTALFSDLYPQFQPAYNFHRGFDCWRFVRGQGLDGYQSGPRTGIDPLEYLHASQRDSPELVMQYLLNRQHWAGEDDYPVAQLFSQASTWLENNAGENQPLYLHVENFSPYEFWDPPDAYYRLYTNSDYRGPRLIHPPDSAALLTPVEMDHVRALYAGTITFADLQLGKLLATVERLGLFDNTLVVFLGADGALMGEQGQLLKGETRLRGQVTHVPLMVYHPERNWAGRRVGGFVQHTDVMPTLLDLLGLEIPTRVTGMSMKAALESGGSSPREWVVTGWGEHASIRTPDWNCQLHWDPFEDGDELYDLRQDPDELRNTAAGRPELVEYFRSVLKWYVEDAWAITQGSFSTVLA